MSWVDDAVKAKPHNTWDNHLVVEKDGYGERTEVAFEHAVREGKQLPYWTCWVFKPTSYVYRLDENCRAPVEHLRWAKDLVAQALEVNVSHVQLGYGENEFDVRPF